MPHWDDDIYLGQAVPSGMVFGTASATQPLRGIGPAGRLYAVDLGRPLTASITAVCAAQAIAGASNALINGSASIMDYTFGQRVAVFTQNTKVGIALQMVSSDAGDTTQTVLVTGRDIYGARMSQVKTLNGTTAVNFTKCFRWVDIVSVSAAMAGTLSLGTRDAFGLPIRVRDGSQVVKICWGNVYSPGDPGTLTTCDNTSPATSSTNDTRGFYEPSSPADGTKRFTVVIILTDAMVGPAATKAEAFGVTQA